MSVFPPNPSHSDSRTREFVRLLGEHDGQLHAFILALVPHWADAHEVAQDVRLRLWEQFDEFDLSGDFGAWARTVAYYKVLAFRKTSARRHARLSGAFVEAAANQASSESGAGEARHQALLECLRHLRAEQRELLLRYYSGNHTLKQIADETRCSFDALRQSMLRTRKALARCVERRLRTEI